jgi:hypothetical protein
LGGFQPVSSLKMEVTNFEIALMYSLGINELVTPVLGREINIQ